MIDITRIDPIKKAIIFDDQIESYRWLKIKEIYVGHQYDGMIYMSSMNTTFSGYVPPDNCPYTGQYKLDIRCRYYYPQTVSNISTMTYAPQIQFADGSSYLGSTFCQRRMRYATTDPNSQSSIYSILCNTLDLSVIPEFFNNFGSNSKFQLFLDPRQLTVVYDSQVPLQTDQVVTVQEFETNYLQDQSQAEIFLGNVTQNSQYVLNSSNSFDVFTSFYNTQTTFEYNRNGTDCFVILNIITMIDKIPSYETLRSINPADKFQLKSVFLFLDVLSQEKMQQYSNSLESRIIFYNLIFTYCSWGSIILILWTQLYYSVFLGRQILLPIIHLTGILQQIQFTNDKNSETQNAMQEQTNHNESPTLLHQNQNQQTNPFVPQQSSFLQTELSTEQGNVIQIDEQIDADLEGVCFSSDTQILLNSFQNLFKILRFTTQNFFKEDASLSLLNLNIQIKHFEQFGNYRALGVCHNNMGVIHYNFGRYQEACESFQKAAIYAKYELNIYSHENENLDFSNSLNRFTVHFRSTLFSKQSQSEYESVNIGQTTGVYDKQMIVMKNKLEQNSIFQQQIQFDQEQLYWNLYNRNQNYIKALIRYLQENNMNLWDTYQDIALENTSISQLYLPQSVKREMLDYYIILKGYFSQDLNSEANCILNRFYKLYVRHFEHKLSHKQSDRFKSGNPLNSRAQGQAQTQSQSPIPSFILQESPININKILLNSENTNGNGTEMLASILLLSPIQKIKQSNNKKRFFSKTINNPNESLINTNNMDITSNNNLIRESESQLFLNRSPNSSKNYENSIFFNDLKINRFSSINRKESLLPQSKTPKAISEVQCTCINNSNHKFIGQQSIQKENENNIHKMKINDQNNNDNLNPSHLQENNNNSKQINNQSHNNNNKLNSHQKNIKLSQNQINYNIIKSINEPSSNSRNNLRQSNTKTSSSKIYDAIESFKNKYESLKTKSGEVKKLSPPNTYLKHKKQNINSSALKVNTSTEQMSRQQSYRAQQSITKAQRSQRKNHQKISKKPKNLDITSVVKKIKNQDKVSQYEFSSDIYFYYYALQQSEFQIIQQNYYYAAQLLTNALEQCEYYLPHLRMQVINKLSTVFQKKSIKSTELSEMLCKYQQLPNRNYQICLISSCHSNFFKKRVFGFANDLINEVLFKEKDTLGIIQYSFEEHLYSQQMGFTQIKMIKSNPCFFEEILLKLKGEKSQTSINKLKSQHFIKRNKENGVQKLNQLPNQQNQLKQTQNQSLIYQVRHNDSLFMRQNSYLKDSQSTKNLKDLSTLKDNSIGNSIINLRHDSLNSQDSPIPYQRKKMLTPSSKRDTKEIVFRNISLQRTTTKNYLKREVSQDSKSHQDLEHETNRMQTSSSSIESVLYSDRRGDKKFVQKNSKRHYRNTTQNKEDTGFNSPVLVNNSDFYKISSFPSVVQEQRNQLDLSQSFLQHLSFSINQKKRHSSIINYDFKVKMIPEQAITREKTAHDIFHNFSQNNLQYQEENYLDQQNLKQMPQSSSRKYSWNQVNESFSQATSSHHSIHNLLIKCDRPININKRQIELHSPIKEQSTSEFINTHQAFNENVSRKHYRDFQGTEEIQHKIQQQQQDDSLIRLNITNNIIKIDMNSGDIVDQQCNSLSDNNQYSVTPANRSNSPSLHFRRMDSSFTPKQIKDVQTPMQNQQQIKDDQKSLQNQSNHCNSFSFFVKDNINQTNSENNNNNSNNNNNNNSSIGSNKNIGSKNHQNRNRQSSNILREQQSISLRNLNEFENKQQKNHKLCDKSQENSQVSLLNEKIDKLEIKQQNLNKFQQLNEQNQNGLNSNFDINLNNLQKQSETLIEFQRKDQENPHNLIPHAIHGKNQQKSILNMGNNILNLSQKQSANENKQTTLNTQGQENIFNKSPVFPLKSKDQVVFPISQSHQSENKKDIHNHDFVDNQNQFLVTPSSPQFLNVGKYELNIDEIPSLPLDSANTQTKRIRENEQVKKDINQNKQNEKLTGEQVFHQGIQAAMKQFVLNSDEKITSYLSVKKFKNSQHCQQQEQKQQKKSTQTYLVYFTDQHLKLNNQGVFNKLCNLLVNLDIELLILVNNDKYTFEEFSHFDNVLISGKSVVSFFNTEQKLLQYVYNYREHVRNDILPLIVEHF